MSPQVTLRKLTLTLLAGLALTPAAAHAHDKGVRVAVSAMALFNSSQQGGPGPSGSTLLTHSDLVYSGKWWSLGGFAQLDKQGGNETDTAFGPKLELHWEVFYLELGWAPLMQRAFTDRSIAKQTGSAWLTGAGVRVPLGSSSPGGSSARGGAAGSGQVFLQFSYKYRVQFLTAQDGTPLADEIIQRDGYPLFGIGYKF